ncbi:PREDICTED: broad-complex core protein isoform X3 [Trachymyrmex cornetzi]|uniref:Broad-complex core protein isoform 6 n=1 Tax=Trachymyrmex cornetzi TaxID=471704 RepID=A0A195DJ57_9HYME|nr:PREDICTED: broad-complex core protein isoform X3 [Trachymyrmex cornetzi]KYN12923.1 Broad-complex core protein isoform 6 [Trachymyrmex cornetzi]
MVDTQHFCLRWNNYQSSITSAFENLRDDEDFVDVTLACDGKSLKAHRVVLSACSPYFRELLKSTPCKHPVIVLQDVAFSDLHALVEFIYHGEVNVHQRSLSSFLKTAEVLRVSGLTQQTDQTDRDELSHVRALASGGGNHLPFHEKSEETFPRGGGGGSPTPVTPTPTTVQQLLRRAQIRRNERRTPDPHDESAKRPRVPSPPLNNNDATPTDFSMVKNNHLSTKVEGNGVHDENSLVEENIKCEPLELTGGNGGGNAGNEDSSDSGAAASDRPPASASSNEHEPEPEHTSAQNFLPESKLFTSTPGSFNFSMAALTTDHTPLSVKFPGLGHGLQTPDLAGTSQGLLAGSGASDEFRCEPCNKNLTSLTRLKRHIQNVHTRPSKEPICNICKRVYSSLNSLRNHKSIYHRQHNKNEQQRKEVAQAREWQRDQREHTDRNYSAQQQQHQTQQHPRMG